MYWPAATMDDSRESRPILPAPEKSISCIDGILSWFYDDQQLSEDLKSKKISDVDAVFLLMNTMVGAGVLQQAMVFEYCGIISATILFVIIGYFTYLGAKTLSRLADASGCTEYSEIAYRAFGMWGALTVDIAIVLFNFTTVITYIIYMGSLMNDIINSYLPDANQWYVSDSFLSVLLTIFVALPICLVRTFGRLTVVSYLSVFLMVLVAVILCIDGSINGESKATGDIQWFSLSGSLMALSSLVYSLGFSPAVLFTYNVLDNQHKKSMSKIVLGAVAGGTTLCFGVGISGYLMFGTSTNSNILVNLSGTAARICDLAMVVHFALFLPGDFFILRASVYNLMTEYTSGGRFAGEAMETTASLATSTAPAIHDGETANEEAAVSTSSNAAEGEQDSVPLIQNRPDNNPPQPPPDSVHDRLEMMDETTYVMFTATTLLIIMGAGAIVEIYWTNSNTVFNFTNNLIGGLAGTVDTFIMPGLCGLYFFEKGSSKYHKCYALLAFGCLCIVGIFLGSLLYLI